MQENTEVKEVTDTTPTSVEATSAQTTPTKVSRTKRGIVSYLLMVVIVLIMATGLLYALERQGRVSTGLFGDLSGGQPVAYVNDEIITRRDHDNSVNQLIQMATAQGVDTTDSNTVSELRMQALDTLINGELLRQAAVAAGMAATVEAIDARFSQIATDLGGEEQLRTKMAEFGITEAVLRRDIENEILIQGLFDERFPAAAIEVTDEEAKTFYDSVSAGTENVPPFEEIKDQIVEQLKRERQQQEVSTLIDSLRGEATIETLI